MRLGLAIFLGAIAASANGGDVTPPPTFAIRGPGGGYAATFVTVEGGGFKYTVSRGGIVAGTVVLPEAARYEAGVSPDAARLYVSVATSEDGDNYGADYVDIYGGPLAARKVSLIARRVVETRVEDEGRALWYQTYVPPPGAEGYVGEKDGFFPKYYCAVPPGFLRWFRLDLVTGDAKPIWSADGSSALTERGTPLGAGNAVDADVTTAWAEGIGGPGIGENLTIDFGGPVTVENVGIIPGYAADVDLYRGNNRIKKARLELSSGETIEQDFVDKPALQYVPLSGEAARWLKITILETYAGAKWDDTCISEITINCNPDI